MFSKISLKTLYCVRRRVDLSFVSKKGGAALVKAFSSKGSGDGGSLKDVVKKKIPIWTETIKALRKEHDKTKIGDIQVSNIYSGMRGMYGLVWETSDLDPEEGISFRGLTVDECRFILPKAEGSKEPLVEGFIWFLITGDVPTLEQAQSLACEMAERGRKLPEPVTKILDACDKCWHPMTTLSIVMNAMANYSKFNEAFTKGIKKEQYWEYVYEDAIDLMAIAPVVSGLIYRKKHMEGKKDFKWSEKGDIGLNFANLLEKGEDKDFIEFVRLYMLLHSDHEGGNVSAHAMHLVSSALADCYKSYAAAMNGLAGPLHGLATQLSLQWLMDIQKKHGENPTPENVVSFAEETLKGGMVVPGYGHAVLRKTDPRFSAQLNFAKEHKYEDPLIKLAETVFQVIPPFLEKGGKVKNPWPNVDAMSGTLLQHFCIQDVDFYTVMFGMARAIGVMSSNIWTRALRHPIERPKSISTCKLRKLLEEKQKENKKGGKC